MQIHNNRLMSDWEQSQATQVEDLIGNLADILNGGSDKLIGEAIAYKLFRTHRTLQQCFWGSILEAARVYAGQPTDLRNEAAVKLAQAWVTAADDAGYEYGLPCY